MFMMFDLFIFCRHSVFFFVSEFCLFVANLPKSVTQSFTGRKSVSLCYFYEKLDYPFSNIRKHELYNNLYLFHRISSGRGTLILLERLLTLKGPL